MSRIFGAYYSYIVSHWYCVINEDIIWKRETHSMVKINRLTGYIDKLRKYKVIVDDKEIGTLKEDQPKYFEPPQGQHTIYLKIDWDRSKKSIFLLRKMRI